MRALHAAKPFQGTERFEIIRLLGRGAADEVYEAFDRLRKVRAPEPA